MRASFKKTLALIAGLALVGGSLPAAMIVEDSFTGVENSWGFESVGSTPGSPTVTAPGTTLRIEFNSGALFDQHFFTTGTGPGSSSLLSPVNDWTSLAAQSLRFAFNPGGAAPLGLGIFFESAGTRYQHDFSSILSVASVYGVDLLEGNGNFYQLSGTLPFADALQAVDLVGIQIIYPTSSTVIYNLDYVQLDNQPMLGGGVSYVPEPGTYAALMTVFASMGLTFRRKLREGFDKLMVAFA